MSIRVLLADDQALFLEGLETLLSVHKDIQVVGRAANGQEAVDLALELRPDVILMDMQMPVLNGIGATRRVKQSLPDCRVIALTTFDDKETIFEALRAGAVGYLLKDVGSMQLAELDPPDGARRVHSRPVSGGKGGGRVQPRIQPGNGKPARAPA